jgi:hypothetical protein
VSNHGLADPLPARPKLRPMNNTIVSKATWTTTVDKATWTKPVARATWSRPVERATWS